MEHRNLKFMVERPLGMVVECLAPAAIKLGTILHTFIRQTVDIIHWAALAVEVKIRESIDESGFIQRAKRVAECSLVRFSWNSAAKYRGCVICAEAKILGEKRECVTFYPCEAECCRERCPAGLQASRRLWCGVHYYNHGVLAEDCKAPCPQCVSGHLVRKWREYVA